MSFLSQYHWSLLLILFFNFFLVLSCLYFAAFVFPKRPLSEETLKRQRSFISNAFFREFWYYLMGPLKKRFIKWGISPNTLTVWGFIFSALAGIAIFTKSFPLAGWMIILAATCDVYDGMLARARSISLKSGAYLDSTLDRLGESFIFLGLAFHFRLDPYWFVAVFVAFTASQIVSYTRARAEGLGFNGARGLFQRAERLIVLCIGISLTSLSAMLNISEQIFIQLTVAILAIGSVQTAVSRGWSTFVEIKSTETSSSENQ